jgi:hypothetical protein
VSTTKARHQVVELQSAKRTTVKQEDEVGQTSANQKQHANHEPREGGTKGKAGETGGRIDDQTTPGVAEWRKWRRDCDNPMQWTQRSAGNAALHCDATSTALASEQQDKHTTHAGV